MDKVLGALISLWLAFGGHGGALHVGVTGPEVKAVQQALATQGFSPRGVDGIYGPNTDQAVRRFEQADGLRVDGLAGPHVILDLLRPKVTQKVLKTGTSGMPVKLLQAELKGSGLSVGPIDGVFGPKTEAAVLSFQRIHHLSADGVVGPKTWGALLAPTVVVQAGDTLAKIAERYGVSADRLVKLNGLSDPGVLQIGEVLRLPPASGSAAAKASAASKGASPSPASSGGSGQAAQAPKASPPPSGAATKWGGAGTPRVAVGFVGVPSQLESASLAKAGVPVTVFFNGVPQSPPATPIDAEVAYASQTELTKVLGGLTSMGNSPKLAFLPTETASDLTLVLKAHLLPLVNAKTPSTDQQAETHVQGGQVMVLPLTPENVAAFPALAKTLQGDGFTLVSAKVLLGAS